MSPAELLIAAAGVSAAVSGLTAGAVLISARRMVKGDLDADRAARLAEVPVMPQPRRRPAEVDFDSDAG